MKNLLHIDLLKEEERYSSRPVRLRVMVPLTACFVTLCLLVWWLLICLNDHSQSQFKKDLQQAINTLTPAHNAVLASRAQEQESRAVIGQLVLFKNSRNLAGETLSALAGHIPENIQFIELRIPPPSAASADASRSASAPTNIYEQVTLRISGRTGREHPSEAVNTLLATFYTPAFTNFIRSATIPKGAFRQDITRNPENREAMLFEITCDCVPRRFQ